MITQDAIGPIARTPKDLAIAFNVMVGDGGYDPADNVTAFAVNRFTPNSYVKDLANYPLSNMRIGGCIILFILLYNFCFSPHLFMPFWPVHFLRVEYIS
jgi:hypothetical protein